ncbi:type II toxin-antitoxin system RelE/ParE family toxin [Candidatus Neptunochlamydia vexilliferae]|uniref:Toxin YoeB n=1 Tax=Candidatus Neptunichlamydia vexilliferae TaxID=1651774 RepID=A0ABS0B0T6_9BACT|nr:hypothetical protein [Candidatus Neptunochlamydia vexilliferae]
MCELFTCKGEQGRFFNLGQVSKKSGWVSIKRIAQRKLDMLDYAISLRDLKNPPNNHLEALKGDLKGYYSIRSQLQNY